MAPIFEDGQFKAIFERILLFNLPLWTLRRSDSNGNRRITRKQSLMTHDEDGGEFLEDLENEDLLDVLNHRL